MTTPQPVTDLIERSNSLGEDPRNTNYGGGNTSAKGTEIDPVTGKPIELLWVKGSGGDLGTLAPAGLAVLRLDRMRALMTAGLVMGLESPSSRAERNARLLAIWNRVPDLDEAVAKIEGVSLADVRDQALLAMSRPAALAVYGPVGRAPSLAAMMAEMKA